MAWSEPRRGRRREFYRDSHCYEVGIAGTKEGRRDSFGSERLAQLFPSFADDVLRIGMVMRDGEKERKTRRKKRTKRRMEK